jgi:hypothetical protein
MHPNSFLSRPAPKLLLAITVASGAAALAGCVMEPAHRPRREVTVVTPAPGPAATTVVIREAPPPLRVEVFTDRPSPRHIWIKGHWRHDGRSYAWVPGHWVLPLRRGAVWVEPRWELRGGGYVFVEGFWR